MKGSLRTKWAKRSKMYRSTKIGLLFVVKGILRLVI